MVWDDTSYRYTIHALGAVECGMDYGAVNPTDVISVGLFQWYATRAANVLHRMRTTNPTEWAAIAPSLEADMAAHSATDSFWNNRYVTRAEILSLNTVMRKAVNKAIENDQAQTDLDNDYLTAGAAAGIDKDTHPETMAFFCNIYNRNPSAARRIVGNCGGDSSLDRIYSYTINDYTEGAFSSRYSTAKTIIANHDVTGVDSVTDDAPPTDPTPGGDTGGTRPTGNASYITQRGTQLILTNKDGTMQFFDNVGHASWLSNVDPNVGADPAPPDTGGSTTPVTDPEGGGTTTVPQGILDLIAWELTKIGSFNYSEGPGRLTPLSSGYTDCSGLHYWAYKTYANTNVGTWTGDQIGHGTLITKDPDTAKDTTKLKKGDLIFFRWGSSSPSTYDHVELYKGNSELLSHGGPGSGPHIFTLNSQIDEAINAGGSIEVRRYLT